MEEIDNGEKPLDKAVKRLEIAVNKQGEWLKYREEQSNRNIFKEWWESIKNKFKK
jgi:hypothetical protein